MKYLATMICLATMLLSCGSADEKLKTENEALKKQVEEAEQRAEMLEAIAEERVAEAMMEKIRPM